MSNESNHGDDHWAEKGEPVAESYEASVRAKERFLLLVQPLEQSLRAHGLMVRLPTPTNDTKDDTQHQKTPLA